jgi:hypothetical protein
MPRARCLFGALVLLTAAPAPAAPPVFEKDVLPVLEGKCLRCHGNSGRKADLDLRSRASMLKGGDTGPALAPGSAEQSLLWVQVAADKMPPGKAKLNAAEKAVIRAWIEGGAKVGGATAAAPAAQVRDGEFWSFRPPVRPPLPTARHTERVRNPIDRFVLARLEEKGLTLSPEADRLTLLRRVTFDLTGLPPTPEEQDAFLNDPAPDAYERLVERLLASPHYGERWGRHWLDLAGYADSEGILDADYVRSAAWRYRDYVIRAFNADKPYDRFLQEQIAGDELTGYWEARETQKELPAEVVEGITATGFLRCASDTSRPDFAKIKNAPGYYFQALDDTVKIVASATLGLTVQCARCPSHKYDPIPQTDYYRLQAVFMSAYRPAQWVPQVRRRLLLATAAQEKEAAAHNARIDAAVAALNKQGDELRRTFAERLFSERLATLPEAIRADVRDALAAAPGKRTEVQQYLAGKFEKDLRPVGPALEQALMKAYPDYVKRSTALAQAVLSEWAKRVTFAEVRALYDLPGEAKTHLLRRGDYLNPGPEVSPAALSGLATPRPFAWAAPPPSAKTSGRRLAFARWLTQPGHPLTARVPVNRLWLHHFGEGLVATPDNFGRTGAAPSHPELLDWLAVELVARGWSAKALHRLMLTSSAYRQASALGPAAHAAAKVIDPDDRLLWRQRMRRLEAEALRDAILAVAGTLNPDAGGPPVPMQRQGDGEVVTPAGPAGARRSVYLQVRRSQPLTLLQVFDQPVIETNCTRRAVSTVASQALALLNSRFMDTQADAFAGRALRERPDAPAAHALRLAFGRPATAAEGAALAEFLARQAERHGGDRRRALADLCHVLLSANEFAYID